jgi:DNA-binding NarL/FixJ family response regulator
MSKYNLTNASALNEPVPRKKKVFLVDDHGVVRNGLAELINQTGDLAVCGDVSSGEEALEKLRSVLPDIAIVDLVLGEMGGLELVKRLKAQYPALPILVLSMHDESFFAERCLRAGARGYIMKKEAIDQVETALRTILDGKIYLSSKMSQELLRTATTAGDDRSGSPLRGLTDRQLEVLEHIGKGLGRREIAKKLGLSVKTIESYQAKLKEKLHLKDASELFQYALHWAERI